MALLVWCLRGQSWKHKCDLAVLNMLIDFCTGPAFAQDPLPASAESQGARDEVNKQTSNAPGLGAIGKSLTGNLFGGDSGRALFSLLPSMDLDLTLSECCTGSLMFVAGKAVPIRHTCCLYRPAQSAGLIKRLDMGCNAQVYSPLDEAVPSPQLLCACCSRTRSG